MKTNFRNIVIGLLLTATTTVVWAGETRIVLLDCSGSVGKGPRSPFDTNLAVVRNAILTVPRHSTLLVLGFGKGTPVPFLTLMTPKNSGPQGKVLNATRAAGVQKFDENLRLRKGEIDPKGTDIEGALFRASRIFSESHSEVRTLIIASDMQQDADEKKLTLKRVSKDPGLIRKANLGNPAERTVPDLHDVKVSVFSAFSDLKTMKPVEIEKSVQDLREYWTQYLKKAGAEIVSYKTNY